MNPSGNYFTTLMGSFMVAIVLTFIPVPDWAEPYRPEWLMLMTIYWSMHTPHKFNLGSSWLAGLTLDVLRGALLGQHALGFAITSFLAIRLHQRVRVYPIHQQALFVAMIMLPYMSITLWIYGALSQSTDSWLYWMPVITSAACWPVVVLAIRATGYSRELA